MTNFHAMLIVILIWLTIILHGTGALPTAIDNATDYFYSAHTDTECMDRFGGDGGPGK